MGRIRITGEEEELRVYSRIYLFNFTFLNKPFRNSNRGAFSKQTTDFLSFQLAYEIMYYTPNLTKPPKNCFS